jgi:hypothetical protein
MNEKKKREREKERFLKKNFGSFWCSQFFSKRERGRERRRKRKRI